MLRISLSVNKNKLAVRHLDTITAGCVNSAVCTFLFGGEWGGYSKTIAFTSAGTTYHVAMQDDMCSVPNAAMQKSGDITIGVVGINSNGDKVVTTNNVTVHVIRGADKDGTQDPDYSPTFIEQVQSMLTWGEF